MRRSLLRTDSRRSCGSPAWLCESCPLHELNLPGQVADVELAALAEIVVPSGLFHAGDHLFRIGDPLRALYLLRAGAFKSGATDPEGREHVTGFLLPGDLLGFDGIYSGRHLYDTVALDTSTVCILPYDPLTDLSGRLPSLRRQLMRLFSKDLVEAGRLAGSYTAEERVAAFLINLSDRLHARGYSATEFNLPMSRRDIGNHLRLATETVTRVLSGLQSAGTLRVHERTIQLVDLPRLRVLSECQLEIRPRRQATVSGRVLPGAAVRGAVPGVPGGKLPRPRNPGSGGSSGGRHARAGRV